jgi:hypothetical protein
MAISTTEWIQRIRCDNAECVSYVDELVRLEVELKAAQLDPREAARASAARGGWTSSNDLDFCPDHAEIV